MSAGRLSALAVLGLTLALGAQAQENAGCAANLNTLRALLGDTALATRWSEVSMDDNMPLLLSIDERGGALQIEFTKRGAGRWAEIRGVVCPAGADYELRIARDQIRLGPAAHWALSLALAGGGVFVLRHRSARQLQIEAQGWSGRFVPVDKD